MFEEFFQSIKKHFLIKNQKIPPFEIENEGFEEYKKARGLFIEDKWERVKTMFQLDEYGNIHPEIEYAVQMAQYGLVCGALIGGSIESIRYTQEFIRNNDTNIYWTRNEALRRISHISMLGFFKGAWKSAPKYCIFLTGFSVFSSCCELYRNKTGIIENTVGGAGIGAILRSRFGIKGMISGGVVGGILGTIYGTIIEVISKLSKKDKLELKYVAIAFAKYKKECKALASDNGFGLVEKQEKFDNRFGESNEDTADRLKHLNLESPVPTSEKKNVEKKSEKTS